jgi:plastocyanin
MSTWRLASICECRGGWRALAPCAAVAFWLVLAPAVAAQGSVTGQLAIVEGPGAERSDFRSAVVYLEPEGRTAPPAAVPEALRATTIAMTQREFVPHVRAIMAGGTVTFPNQDPFSHNVFSNADPAPFDLGLYRRGVSRSATVPRVGVYPVYCNIHSRMTSFVVAVPTPYVTYPGADGRFSIGGVPEGTYLLHAWHERAGNVTREIVVPPNGLAVPRVVLDARAYVPAPHLNKFGLPYTAIRADRY